jgi:hypothetical protein
MSNNEHSCIVGLCVKNNAKGLPKVFENMSNLKTLFDKFLVVVYYDESKDNSLDLLIELSVNYGLDYVIINEECEMPTYNSRIANISKARNYIINYIYHFGQEYDMFVMMDSNDYSCQGNIKLNVINKYLNKPEYDKWDSVSFARNPYYDVNAYSDDVFQIGCMFYPKETSKQFTTALQYRKAINERIRNTIFSPSNRGKLIPVDSAFCGFALYKKEAFRGCRYDGMFSFKYINKELLQKNMETYKIDKSRGFINKEDSEHRQFHLMAKHNNGAKIMIACEQAFTYFKKQ